jgi:hypothetical protein
MDRIMHGNSEKHPSLDTLVEFVDGLLTDTEAELIDRHLESCVACRLEARRLARFATIDNDTELLAAADWSRARFELNKMYQDKIKPAVELTSHQSEDRTQEKLPLHGWSGQSGPSGDVAQKQAGWQRFVVNRGWWLAPVAAAAVLVIVFLGQDKSTGPELQDPWSEPLRGEQIIEPAVVPISPLGEVSSCPQHFSWQVAEAFDTYTLEIFTPNLELVFRQANIPTARFTVTDALQQLLEPDQTYLWSVQGLHGLRTTSVSASGWFRILAE